MGKEILSQCRMTVSEGIKSKGWTLLEDLIKTGFKITSSSPLIIEKGATSREDLIKLTDLLTSGDEIQECSGKSASAENINKENNVQEKQGIRNISEESALHDQERITEPEVEDYVMKKHSFQLAGEYFKDRDWKELFDKAKEINEGFCFRGKDVSADEYRMLQNLKKIIFETIDIPDDEAYRVKEAAEYINCVDHGVCVIDYNSRPYLVGPKAQVHAAREEILYTLKEDGVDCHLTSPKALPKHDVSKEKEKNTNTSNVIDKANAEKDKEFASSPETESDAESDKTEYIVEKGDFKLAKQYFEGRPEHQYFDMAVRRGGGYLFSFSSAAADCSIFMKTLRRINFETVSHRENDKAKVRSIADQLNCGDFDVKVIEKGNKLFLVGLKDKVARMKQKIISELYYNAVEGSDSVEDDDDTSKPSKGGARPKKFNVPRSLQDKRTNDFRFGSEDTSKSPHQVETFSGTFGGDVDPGVYTGHYSDIRVQIHQADITKLNVDCIVNATNSRLKHAGGVARVIATAAGRELEEACERFTVSGNTVEVTGVFVSPGGRLPAKYVLHAVCPKWDFYYDKMKCTDDLRRTVLRCLVEAMRLGMSSIALPSISAAIFKVPKELCARIYMEAVKSFDAIFGKDKDCTLKEIHFVDIDDIMVNYIQESFMKYWEEPCDSFKKRMDEQFSQDYRSSKKPLPPKSGASSTLQISENQGYSAKGLGDSPAPQTKPLTTGSKTIENESEYQIRGIRLFIVSKPALSIHTDPIITIGEDFDKLSGIEDYRVKANRRQCKDYPTQKQAFEFTYFKRKGQHRRVLCSWHPDPKSPDEIKSAVDKLDVALRMLSLKGGEKKEVTSFVLTSSILYADLQKLLLHRNTEYLILYETEPNNKKKESRPVSQKLAESLAQNVFEFLDTASQNKSCSLRRVFIATSEDALPHLYKVFDSRATAKKVDHAARGSTHHNPGPRHQSPAIHGSGHQGSSTFSSYSGHTTYGRQHSSGASEMEPRSLGAMSSRGGTGYDPSSGSSVDQRVRCGICVYLKETVKPTSCCRKPLCKDCNDKVSFCPYCRKQWKIRLGNQPDGNMRVSLLKESAYGHESRGSWKIEYVFSSGFQKREHPNPDEYYKGTTRIAYIPAIEGAMDILRLLRLAFIRRLTFTIGRSQTTGRDNRITWNDIHHKTSLQGGDYGFPDPTYFQRVMEELRDKGVTLESMTEAENLLIKGFEQSLISVKYFSDYLGSTSGIYY